MRKFWESIYCPNYIRGYNPFILKGMNKSIERLVTAINNRERIIIYGTNTVDGICAIASLSLVLRYLNADVEYMIHDGGEECKEVDTFDIKTKVDFLGGELLITLGVDLVSKQEVELCESLGIDLIVLENKKTDEKRDYIYINPRQKGCQYRYKTLSISALTFKLMQAIAIYYNMKSINKYLDLILIGTKWAGSSSRGENAVFLKEGKKFLDNTNNIGLRAIINFNNVEELDDENIDKIINLLTPTTSAVGMISNARIVLELLTTDDEDRAEQISKYLYNTRIRQR
ncbi:MULTISPECIES: DHH family phosphoesterase [Clostridium]|uniref:DHH family phosphoesterase n=3 Tax=Clostridium TaxID=1485 RepID=A0ABN1LJZ4_9CLOT|nr:DHH family phosphoesterase [Clostridium baratii]AIY83554.1 putative single-stranded-DNA-specific exonuclease recJ [Clostridium baratii str. Sullivan]AQM58993.1 phosphoesterase [Clostridium baratii]KJU70869.1 phosphoesterase [Clostridium baratii]MBS6006531.1 phosphoesterase [Clostridium baratii]MBT9832752.1 phosphoesterase [Clostridium baratii]